MAGSMHYRMDDYQRMIYDILKDEPMTTKELRDRLSGGDEVDRAIRQLRKWELIRIKSKNTHRDRIWGVR